MDGGVLIEGRRRIDLGEAEWLAQLAEFDSGGWWAADGHLSCVAWLVHHCHMGYSTAKDKLRVALELTRRPLLAAAFNNGELSYCKIRTLTRITDADEETDIALLAAAAEHTVAELEHVVRHWELLHQQDNPTRAMKRWNRRGMRRASGFGGISTIEITQLTEENERLLSIIDAYLTSRHPVDKASREEPSPGEPVGKASLEPSGGSEPVDEASREEPDDDPGAARTWAQRRVDALMDIVEAGLDRLADDGHVEPDRATVDVIVDYDTLCEHAAGTARLAGAPLRGEAARRLACDAGLSRIIVRGASEILDVGRKTRTWTASQRRAIAYRHDNHCAFPACQHRILQIHHTTPWQHGGPTDLHAGIPLCAGHHHLVHEGGWTVTYNPATTTTTFTNPNGEHVHAPAPLRYPKAA